MICEIDYDSAADVLYIQLDRSDNVFADEVDEGNFVRIHNVTNQIVGITILDFKERYLNG